MGFNEINKFDECESINGYSTLYSNNLSDYFIISDEICNNKFYSYISLSNDTEEEEKKEEEEEEKEKKEEEEEEKEKEMKLLN